MFIACVVISILTAMALTASASMKLRKDPRVIQTIHEVAGVPLRYFPALAGLELAGALGILVGLWLAPLGIAAAVGVALYMIGAIAAHVRVKDMKGATNPVVPLLFAVATLVLRIATA